MKLNWGEMPGRGKGNAGGVERHVANHVTGARARLLAFGGGRKGQAVQVPGPPETRKQSGNNPQKRWTKEMMETYLLRRALIAVAVAVVEIAGGGPPTSLSPRLPPWLLSNRLNRIALVEGRVGGRLSAGSPSAVLC